LLLSAIDTVESYTHILEDGFICLLHTFTPSYCTSYCKYSMV